MPDELKSVLQQVVAGQDATAAAMSAAIGAMMDGRAAEPVMAALLTALRMKGEAVEELVGAARAMRERATPIRTRRTGLLDTCGTGGDQLHTFNISTATALVAAAAGIPVAKHGNRSVSSCSGSADVLEALRVNLQLTPERVGACLDEVGIGFCFAPLLHGAMKHAAPVRKQLGFRTIFNLLGPLTNPAGAEYQLVGAHSPATAEKLARALAQLGRRRALVVCGAGSLDEVSLWGETVVFEVADGQVSTHRWTAAMFGFPECDVSALRVGSAAESAEVIRRIFAGEQGPAREIVIVNTAAAVIAAERADQPREAAALAAETIDSGRAKALLQSLIEFTNG